jgi:hypothetical protein
VFACPWRQVRALPALKCLSLSGCTAISPAALGALTLPKITTAGGGGSGGGGDDAGAKVGEGTGTGIEILRRRARARKGTACTGGGGKRPPAPVCTPAPPNLVALDLSRCSGLSDAAGPLLARMPPSLEHLDLSHCPVGNMLLDYLTYKVGRCRLTRSSPH